MAERTVTELISDLKADAAVLISDTSAIAKEEMKDTGKKVGIGSALIGLAGFIVLLAIIALTIAFGYGLVAVGLPAWAAFLIVFGVYLLVAAGLVFLATRFFRAISAPTRTKAAIAAGMAAFGGERPTSVPDQESVV